MRLEMKLIFQPLRWAWLMGIVLAGCSQVPKLPDARTPTIERFRQAPSDRGASTLSDAHLASRVGAKLELARVLVDLGWQIVSTGGTAAAVRAAMITLEPNKSSSSAM